MKKCQFSDDMLVKAHTYNMNADTVNMNIYIKNSLLLLPQPAWDPTTFWVCTCVQSTDPDVRGREGFSLRRSLTDLDSGGFNASLPFVILVCVDVDKFPVRSTEMWHPSGAPCLPVTVLTLCWIIGIWGGLCTSNWAAFPHFKDGSENRHQINNPKFSH